MTSITAKKTHNVDQIRQSKISFSEKTKKILCALVVIAALGCIIAGIIGVCGHFHIGSLSALAQVPAIALMVAGLVGVILLIVGIAGLCCAQNRTQANGPQVSLNQNDEAAETAKKSRQEQEERKAAEEKEAKASAEKIEQEQKLKEAKRKQIKRLSRKNERSLRQEKHKRGQTRKRLRNTEKNKRRMR